MDKYQAYLEDQRADTLGAGLGYKYMPKLLELLPDLNLNGKDVLDIGCGPFTTYEWIKDRYPEANIKAIDIGRCVETESKKWSQEKASCLTIGDAHKLIEVFPDTKFDLIISFHAFEHMFNLPLVVQNISRLLKPNGLLYYSLPIPAYNWGKGHWFDVPDVATMNNIVEQSNLVSEYIEYVIDYRYRPEREMIGLAKNGTTI